MTAQHAHQDAGKHLSLKRLLVGTAAIPAAALGLMMFFAPDAEATPTEYVIPAAAVSFSTGALGVGSLSGSFTFDPSGIGTYSNVDIHLSATAAATNGPFTVIVPLSSSPSVLFASNGTTPVGNVELEFANPLSGVSDPLIGVSFETSATSAGQFVDVRATAEAQIPEPSSIAILGAALGLFGLRRRALRKG